MQAQTCGWVHGVLHAGISSLIPRSLFPQMKSDLASTHPPSLASLCPSPFSPQKTRVSDGLPGSRASSDANAPKKEQRALGDDDGKPKGRTINLARITGGDVSTAKPVGVKDRLGPQLKAAGRTVERVDTQEQNRISRLGTDQGSEGGAGRGPGRMRIVRSWNEHDNGDVVRGVGRSAEITVDGGDEEAYEAHDPIKGRKLKTHKRRKNNDFHDVRSGDDDEDDRWPMEHGV